MELKKYIKRVGRYLLTGLPVQHVTANIVTLLPNKLLCGRTALITGGTSGIGYTIAEAFLRSGASVCITGRDEARVVASIHKLKNQCSIGMDNEIHFLLLDNRDVQSFSERLKEAEHICGKIDILVNNAGLLGGDISTATEEEYDAVLDTNLKGTFFLSQMVARNMKQNKIKGNILNIASSSSFRPAASAYTLSKWGLRGLTLGLAKSFAPYGIVVNGIAPGPTVTPMILKDVSSNLLFEGNPLGRYALPEEIANMAVFLVSDMGRTVVGDIVCMTGGAGLITFDDVNYNF